MFYYYGRIKQIAHLYPKPKYSTIIEPFAGSAAYALHYAHPDTKVILIDKNPNVADVWHYLLAASKNDILSLPDVSVGDDIRKITTLSPAERKLIGFHINPGSASPCNFVMKASRWAAGKKYITNNIHRIKGWEFLQQEYTDAPQIEATWFIDPPFEVGGNHYTCNSIDYNFLAEWSKNRSGQVIVCEAEPATWLPFTWLGDGVNNGGLNGAKKRSNLIWTNTQSFESTDMQYEVDW